VVVSPPFFEGRAEYNTAEQGNESDISEENDRKIEQCERTDHQSRAEQFGRKIEKRGKEKLKRLRNEVREQERKENERQRRVKRACGICHHLVRSCVSRLRDVAYAIFLTDRQR
jgi:hypothetical protein